MKAKKLVTFLIVNFAAFLVVEFVVARWLHWWTYGSIWSWGEIDALGFSLFVYLGWLVWLAMTLGTMWLCGIRWR